MEGGREGGREDRRGKGSKSKGKRSEGERKPKGREGSGRSWDACLGHLGHLAALPDSLPHYPQVLSTPVIYPPGLYAMITAVVHSLPVVVSACNGYPFRYP